MRLLVLGPLEVSVADGPQTIAGSKERTILACLVAHVGRVVPVDELVEELWGNDLPAAPEKNLASFVSRLRRQLQPRESNDSNTGTIEFRSGGYILDGTNHDIDAVAFERLSSEGHKQLTAGRSGEAEELLQRALALWRGTAYQDFRDTSFGRAEGERLEQTRRTAGEDLIDAKLSNNADDPAMLVPELEAMVLEEPLREHRWGQLIVALYQSGRQAESLQAFSRAREVLVQELGIEPGPELQRLQSAVLAHDPDLKRGMRGPAPEVSPEICPYKGLARFEADDSSYYFGREALVKEGVAKLAGGNFLALVGASGSGKSSLLRAGLLGALAKGALPGSDQWGQTTMRPGEQPLKALRRAIDVSIDSHRHIFAIDQFEEAFTLCNNEAERMQFLDTITELVSDVDDGASMVLAMRADFYGRCAQHRAFASLVTAHQILVGPMDAAELRRAIERPAERVGLTVEPRLIDALVSDTLGQPGGLPLLSTALLELWSVRRDRTLSLESYLRAGGVHGAVARLAEDAFARLTPDDQEAAKAVLLRLATSGGNDEVVRRRASLSEFDLDRDDAAARAVRVLTDARLITISDGVVEVAHEALLREWPRLSAWLLEDAESRALHLRLTNLSQSWDASGRDTADLYRGARLTATLDWADHHRSQLNDLERTFLAESRRASEGEVARTNRANRRLRLLLAGVGVLLILSLTVGALALSQQSQTREALTIADAGRLAFRSRLEQDPVLALLQAREAVALSNTPETRSALFAALERGPAITHRVFGSEPASPAGDETQWIAGSPDGRILATGDKTPIVELFDAVELAPIGNIDVGAGTGLGAFSAAGRTLAVTTREGDIVAFDVRTQTEIERVRTERSVDAMAFDPDGTTLMTAEAARGDELLVPRDPVSLDPRGRAIPAGDHVDQIAPLAPFSLAFSADGQWLVTTHPGGGPTIVWNHRLQPVDHFAFGGNEVAVSPKGARAAVIQNTGEGTSHTATHFAFLNLRTHDTKTTTVQHGGKASTQFETTGAVFTPDGQSLVTAGNDSRVSIWDARTASVRRSLVGTGDVPQRGPVVAPDGSSAFTTDRSRGIVRWDLVGDESIARPFTVGTGFSLWPFFAMSPDGQSLAVASVANAEFGKSGTITLLDTSDFQVMRRIRYRGDSPMGLAFSPDSTELAVASCCGRRTPSRVRLWSVTSGEPTSPYLPGTGGAQVWAMTFSPDGHELAGGGPVQEGGFGGRAFVWDLTHDARIVGHVDTDQPINQLLYTPDGDSLVAVTGQSEGGDLLTWHADSLAPELNVPIDNVGVYSADVSANSETVVTGGQAGPRLWELSTGEPRGLPLTGLDGFASTVDFSSDGTLVVGADTAGDVLLWDVASGAVMGDPLPGPTADDNWLAASFTPDSKRVVIVSETGSAWAWDVGFSQWLRRACEIAGRSLTESEWRELLPDRAYDPSCAS